MVRQPAKIPGQIRIKDDETHVTPYAYSSFYTASRASDRIDSLLRSNNINVELADLNLGNIIEPNIVLDSIESDNYLESEIANATKITRVITQGEQIVARNDKSPRRSTTPSRATRRNSMPAARHRRKSPLTPQRAHCC